MDDGPWTFNQQVLLLKKLGGNDQLQNINLTELVIWIQVYDLPIGFNSEVILKSIGDYVGRFLGSDPKYFQGLWRNYLRIKVAIDVRRPLRSMMKIKKSGGEWIQISFKYERLPAFCFYCGKIGHLDKFCEALFDNPQGQEERKYDSSLKAPIRKQTVNRENQWMRGADGRALIPIKTSVTADGSNGKGKEGERVTVPQDSGKPYGVTGGKIRVIDVTTIIEANDKDNADIDINMGENDGIIISKQKRVRTKEDGLDQGIVMGHSKSTVIGMYMDLGDEVQQKKKLGIGGTCFTGPPATMSTLFWNCRGLGDPRTVQQLLDLVQLKKPMIVFLMETMIDHNRIDCIRSKMKYEGLFTVAGPGHGGGLALFWKQIGSVLIKSSSPNYIDTEINLADTQPWRLTCFYRYPERSRRKESWRLLRLLAAQSTLPWAILGDFNDILRANEKKGKNYHRTWLLNGFRDTMFDCGVSDLPLEGFPLWERGRGTERWVQEKLDRVFVNDEWQGMFPTNKVQNLIAPSSDHSAIYLQISVWRQVPHGHRFRFENSWLKEERCSEIVADCWQRNEGRDITEKIESCANELKVWGERIAKIFKEKVRRCRGIMERLRGCSDSFSIQCYKEATKEYSILLSQ